MNLPNITFYDLLIFMAWAMIIFTLFVIFYKPKLGEKSFFVSGLFFRIIGGFLFGLVYVYFYQGGDTTAYYDGAICLNKLMFNDPLAYFKEIFGSQDIAGYYQTYSVKTGYPPIWIYREPQGFFICKVSSLFTLLSFGSYWVANLLISSIVFIVVWKLYNLILRYNIIKPFHLAIALFFLPSVVFWCSAISKDAFIFIAYIYLTYKSFKWLSFKEKPKLYSWIFIIFSLICLISIRSFMFLAFILPLFLIIIKIYSGKISSNFFRIFIRFLALGVTITFLFFFLRSSSASIVTENLNELEIIHNDFVNNDSYGDNKYELNIPEFTLVNLILVIPQALNASFFRPFVWEAHSVFMLLSSMEGLFFLFLTIRLIFYKNSRYRMKSIINNDILLFMLIIVFILGFIVGISSILFGVLVRFKTILIPFLAIILLSNLSGNRTKNEIQI